MADTNIKCGKLIKCYDYCTRPCVRVQGHPGGCNPFSDTEYPFQLTETQKEVMTSITKAVMTMAEVTTENHITRYNCLWSDVYGMCIYQLGHKGPHKSLGDRGQS